MATITARIRELLAAHPSHAPSWRERALQLAASTTSRVVFEKHPLLKRLRELDEGWLDKAVGVRLDAIYPALAGVQFASAIDLELVDDEGLDQSGPFSDFDPLNSAIFASVPFESTWFSLVCLPGEAMTRWPVVMCDPSAGDDSVATVAVNVEHFLHQWMCRDGPTHLSPVASAPEHAAGDIIRVMAAAFRVNEGEATALLEYARDESAGKTRGSLPAAFAPYVDPAKLRALDRLALPPE
ncbi:MAG: hypothetical protein SFZ23_04715 [Planctomycetota bacterium]|nr:hypothetical protein [Planctomycetota bacterium]